ncbi:MULTISPECIES: glycosyltransferase family 2 protein [Pseudoalteromonas]|uniref:glycosyltransferase family 2 protein n=1 Tax=Pseudoalteromonas TaxID=53246 RepID=UPI000977251C|nr:glycosyltransferase family 2 protein [Pseudoalteromonas sp. EB27]|tara:strand:- start:1805 stop:2734 length:930 start_codon:yes stop_codon:yes gene_type:complete
MSIEISVIIPNYNCKAYLAKAITSVVKQTKVQLEIIVIDDGSTDGSVEWLEDAQATFGQLRIIQQSNSGVANVRNEAIKAAIGDYIAFLDADDYWSDDKLHEQLQYMQTKKDCVLSFTNYMHVDENYNPIVDCYSYWPEFSEKIDTGVIGFQNLEAPLGFLLFANVIGTSSVMVKRTAINYVNRFDSSLKSASDWDCWLKLARIGNVGFSTKISMDYLMRSDSITANRTNRLNAMKEIVSRFKKDVNINTRFKAQARILECYAEYYRELGKKFKALPIALTAFVMFPHKRNLRSLLHDIKNTLTFLIQK